MPGAQKVVAGSRMLPVVVVQLHGLLSRNAEVPECLPKSGSGLHEAAHAIQGHHEEVHDQ